MRGHLRVARLRHLLDVGARGEQLLAAVDDHRPDGRIRTDRSGRRRKFFLHLRVQRVHRRPVQPDGGDGPVDLDPDMCGPPSTGEAGCW